MSTIHMIPEEIRALYETKEVHNAVGVLATACPEEWGEIIGVLSEFRLRRSEILEPGKNKSKIAKYLDAELLKFGWIEKRFQTSVVVDGVQTDAPTHAVDCFKGRVALEVEWNNKDPFFDRDLNNFRLLFDLGVIDVGVIVTRTFELQEIFKNLGRGSSYGASTTHHGKLWPKMDGSGAGGCPVIAFAISDKLYIED